MNTHHLLSLNLHQKHMLKSSVFVRSLRISFWGFSFFGTFEFSFLFFWKYIFIKVYTSIYHSGETPNREVKIGEEKAGLNSDIIIDSFIPIYPQWSMYIFILMPILFPIVMIGFSWSPIENFSALISSLRRKLYSHFHGKRDNLERFKSWKMSF